MYPSGQLVLVVEAACTAIHQYTRTFLCGVLPAARPDLSLQRRALYTPEVTNQAPFHATTHTALVSIYRPYLDRVFPFVLVAVPLENSRVQKEVIDLSAEPEAPLALGKKCAGGYKVPGTRRDFSQQGRLRVVLPASWGGSFHTCESCCREPTSSPVVLTRNVIRDTALDRYKLVR